MISIWIFVLSYRITQMWWRSFKYIIETDLSTLLVIKKCRHFKFNIFKYFPQKHLKLFYRSFCQSYDMKQHSTKVFRDIVNALGSFIQSLFLIPPTGNPATTNQAGKGLFSFSFLYCNLQYSLFWGDIFIRILWLV